MSTQPTILITGASGSNGQELAQLFIANNLPVRLMVRNREKVQEFDKPGVEIVEADFDKPESLEAALQGVQRAFLLTPSSEKAEEQQLRFLVAAKEAGVERIVNLSQLHADAESPNRFLRYHAVVDQAIRDAGFEYTHLKPNLFMQGLLNFAPLIAQKSEFYAAVGDGKVSVVDVCDIADVAFAALTEDGHVGKSYDLTGPEALTHAEMAQKLSVAVGREIKFVDVPPEVMHDLLEQVHFPAWQADGLIEEYAQYSAGQAAELASGVKDALGNEPRKFYDFAWHYAEKFC